MATLKLKRPRHAASTEPGRRKPVRGRSLAPRPTLAQARAEREQQARRDERPPREAPGTRDERPRAAQPPRPGEGGPRRDRQPRPTDEHLRAERPRAARYPDAPRTPPREPRGTPDERPRAAQAPRPGEGGPRRDRQPRPTDEHLRADRPRPARRPDAPRTPPRDRPAPRREAGAPARPARASGGAEAPGDTPRLSKRMSELGLASRREADEWIARGWVRVDGRVVSTLGARVRPDARIELDPRARGAQSALVTVLLNKPIGYVSGQAEDGHQPAATLVTPENHWAGDRSGIRWSPAHRRSLVPAGRLDFESTGLLVLTQDGRVARRLVAAEGALEKEYLVRVVPAEGTAPAADALARLRHGLVLDGVALRAAEVDWINEDQLRIVLRQGRKRQIRRMCAEVGYAVTGLKRVRIGAIPLGDLPAGQWRYLAAGESFEAAARPRRA
jgi:23S rRNA pseudouridine2604 synthase